MQVSIYKLNVVFIGKQKGDTILLNYLKDNCFHNKHHYLSVLKRSQLLTFETHRSWHATQKMVISPLLKTRFAFICQVLISKPME